MKIYNDNAFSKSCGDDITYGFYGRTGGVSKGIYSSLNCGNGTTDDKNAVVENRSRIAANIGSSGDVISFLWQSHSSDSLLIDAPVAAGNDRPKADALVTDKKGLPIGVLTADCGPVLFAAKKQNGAPVIGAAHAGWGGALGGVLEDTIAKMVQAGAVMDSMIACIGPTIGPASYEVRDDFMKPFLERHDESEHFFKIAKAGHKMFDLPGYIAMRLALAGVHKVRITGIDTYKEEESCFSFRRATHRGEQDYGRQMSVIVIKD